MSRGPGGIPAHTESTVGLPAGIRVVLGADEAGVDYKNRILEDLRSDPRVSEIIDIGVNRSDAPELFTRPYPMWASRPAS